MGHAGGVIESNITAHRPGKRKKIKNKKKRERERERERERKRRVLSNDNNIFLAYRIITPTSPHVRSCRKHVENCNVSTEQLFLLNRKPVKQHECLATFPLRGHSAQQRGFGQEGMQQTSQGQRSCSANIGSCTVFSYRFTLRPRQSANGGYKVGDGIGSPWHGGKALERQCHSEPVSLHD